MSASRESFITDRAKARIFESSLVSHYWYYYEISVLVQPSSQTGAPRVGNRISLRLENWRSVVEGVAFGQFSRPQLERGNVGEKGRRIKCELTKKDRPELCGIGYRGAI